ncbi:hypothetical protein Ssi03_65480 [Sphaerisporangium siamense]|nr:hypothetical protein Ssi03_65480 [Sphaerisporangium siamense]
MTATIISAARECSRSTDTLCLIADRSTRASAGVATRPWTSGIGKLTLSVSQYRARAGQVRPTAPAGRDMCPVLHEQCPTPDG